MSRPAGMTLRQASPADQWVSRAAGGTVTALAGLAGAISYSHMRQLAWQHGQAGWHAHAFPLSVDGLEIVASLVLLASHRSGRRPGWLPWAALVLGTAGSLAANVATAGPGTISRIIAGWPALALLIAVKLLAGMLNHPSVTVPQPPAGQDHHGQHRQPRRLAILPGHPAQGVPATSGRSIPNRQAARQHASRSPASEPRHAAGPEPGIAGLLSAARVARDDLHRAGQPLTRDSLAARLRATGHPLRNSRLTPLLQTLRSDTTPARQAHRSDKPPDPGNGSPDPGNTSYDTRSTKPLATPPCAPVAETRPAGKPAQPPDTRQRAKPHMSEEQPPPPKGCPPPAPNHAITGASKPPVMLRYVAENTPHLTTDFSATRTANDGPEL